MSIQQTVLSIESEIEKLSQGQRQSLEELIRGVVVLAMENEDVERAIPERVKTLVMDAIQEATLSYGMRGAKKTRQIFVEALSRAPKLFAMLPRKL